MVQWQFWVYLCPKWQDASSPSKEVLNLVQPKARKRTAPQTARHRRQVRQTNDMANEVLNWALGLVGICALIVLLCEYALKTLYP